MVHDHLDKSYKAAHATVINLVLIRPRPHIEHRAESPNGPKSTSAPLWAVQPKHLAAVQQGTSHVLADEWNWQSCRPHERLNGRVSVEPHSRPSSHPLLALGGTSKYQRPRKGSIVDAVEPPALRVAEGVSQGAGVGRRGRYRPVAERPRRAHCGGVRHFAARAE